MKSLFQQARRWARSSPQLQQIRDLRRQLRIRYHTLSARVRCASMGRDVIVNHRSQVTPHTHIGNNVHMNQTYITGVGEVRIGDNVHFGPEVVLISSNHNFKGTKIPYDATHIEKPITIEDNVWIGTRAVILGGVTIGEGAIIQAGAVVHKDVEKYGIAGGNPAKVFAHRDPDHYEELKAQGKFH